MKESAGCVIHNT